MSYKSNAAEAVPLPEGADAGSSDSSDAYSGAESADESEDDVALKGKRQKSSPQTKTPATTPTKKQVKNTINHSSQQTPKKQTPSQSRRKPSEKTVANARGGAKSSVQTPKAKAKATSQVLQGPTPTKSPQKRNPKNQGEGRQETPKKRSLATPQSKRTEKSALATPEKTPPAGQ